MRTLATTLLIAALLAGCATETVAPVVERSTPPPAPADRVAQEYVVQPGDTLYGIAFRHKRDYREVAAINRIAPPYVVRPGQRLRLDAPAAARVAPADGGAVAVAPVREEGAVRAEPLAPPPVATPRPAPVEVTRTTTVTTTTTTTPPRGEPVTRVTRTTTQETLPAPTPVPSPAATPAPPVEIATAPVQRVAGVGWRWPAAGRIVNGFDAADSSRQGLDIAGSAGQPVLAAADGEVVYSGNGLIGYGELIIIKHDAEFLSAYGYNRKRLVAEGDRVRAGQAIAEMGRSPAAVDVVHFEIRRGGKPVDPLRYLPRR